MSFISCRQPYVAKPPRRIAVKLYIAGEAHHTGPRARFLIDWMVHPCTKGRALGLGRAPVLSLWLGFGVNTARSRFYAGGADWGYENKRTGLS
jgi:hypothetical protein